MVNDYYQAQYYHVRTYVMKLHLVYSFLQDILSLETSYS